MDKATIIEKLIGELENQLKTMTEASHAAHEAAIHPESQPEDQYDTRGLEASYLAGAQSKRALELEQSITQLRHLEIQSFDSSTPIASTALIEVECDGENSFYLMLPKGGGLKIIHEGQTVKVVTPLSPLGGGLLGKKIGDQIEVTIKNSVRDYDIISVS